METKANYIMVGAATIAGIVLLMLFAVQRHQGRRSADAAH